MKISVFEYFILHAYDAYKCDRDAEWVERVTISW